MSIAKLINFQLLNFIVEISLVLHVYSMLRDIIIINIAISIHDNFLYHDNFVILIISLW